MRFSEKCFPIFHKKYKNFYSIIFHSGRMRTLHWITDCCIIWNYDILFQKYDYPSLYYILYNFSISYNLVYPTISKWITSIKNKLNRFFLDSHDVIQYVIVYYRRLFFYTYLTHDVYPFIYNKVSLTLCFVSQ